MINIERLKDIREDHDITQTGMAEILGVKRSTYSLWEIGISIIPLSNLIDFADYFNYSIDYVLGLTNDRNIKIKKGFDYKELGNNIKKYRIKAKLSQALLAKNINVTQACVVRWEKGITKISIPNLYKLSKVFNVSLSALCGKEPVLIPV